MTGLSVRNIYKKYENKPLLSGLSLEVGIGETICLLGASGSGKSTLLRIIAGLEQPDSGAILWNDEDLAEIPTHKRKFGFMFQDYALFPHMTVAENIAFGLNLQETGKEKSRSMVTETLERFNLVGYESRRVNDLSGGEQQRIALARTLAPRPRLLLLDEPLAALDRSLRAQLLQEIHRVLHETGTPAIYVTHDQEEAFAIADWLLILEAGNFLQSGSPEDVYQNPASIAVAKFFGLTNLIEGKVIVVNSRPVVQTVIGDFYIENDALKNINPSLNQMVTLVLRKANRELSDNDPDIKNSFSAVVGDIVFKEEGYKTTILTKDIRMDFLLDQRCAEGEMIQLVIDPSDISVLQEK
jgi:ABC-type Fe3+/spermidine/putrescine transport system ATPase subunit